MFKRLGNVQIVADKSLKKRQTGGLRVEIVVPCGRMTACAYYVRSMKLVLVCTLCAITANLIAQSRLPIKWAKLATPLIRTIARSPNGAFQAIGGPGGVQILSSATGAVIQDLPTAIPGVDVLAFSPNGTQLAIGGSGTVDVLGAIELWNVQTGKLIHESRNLPTVSTLQFTPDGSKIALGSTGTSVLMFSTNSLNQVDSFPTASGTSAWAIAISPNGKQLAIGGVAASKGVVEVWDIKSHTQVANLDASIGQRFGFEEGVTTMAYSPDGKTLASSSSEYMFSAGGPDTLATDLMIWNTGDYSQRFRLYTDGTSAIAFSPDSSMVGASGSYPVYSGKLTIGSVGTVNIWQAATGLPVPTPASTTDNIGGFYFSLDGKSIVDVGSNHTGGLLEKWRIADKSSLGTQSIAPFGYGKSFVSPDGKVIAVRSSPILLLDADTGMTLAKIPTTGTSLGWVPGSRNLVCAGSSGSGASFIEIWDTSEMTLIKQFASAAQYGVDCIAISPDAKTLVTSGRSFQGGFTPVVEVWDLTQLQLTATLNLGTVIPGCLAISPDGKNLAVGESIYSSQGSPKVAVLNLKSGSLTSQRQSVMWEISTICYSPDGKKLMDGGMVFSSISRSGVVECWDVETGASLPSPTLTPLLSPITGFLFSPDGSSLLISTDEDLLLVSVPRWKQINAFPFAGVTAMGSVLNDSDLAVTDLGGSLEVVASPFASVAPIKSFTISPSNVRAGLTTTATVTLVHAAPPTGAIVSLSSDNPSIQVQSLVTVPPGATHLTFQVATWGSSSSFLSTLTAQSGPSTAKATLTVTANPPQLSSLSMSVLKIKGGNSVVGTLTLSVPASSSGVVIQLGTSGSTIASVPSTLTIPPGQSSATFTLTTKPVNATGSVMVTARLNSVIKSVTLQIAP